MGKRANLFVIVREKAPFKRDYKICSTCHKQKSLQGFHPRKDSPDGRTYQCRLCKNAADRERYRKYRRPEAIRESMAWNKANPEKFKKNNLKWKNKPEVKERLRIKARKYSAQWRKRHRKEWLKKHRIEMRKYRLNRSKHSIVA